MSVSVGLNRRSQRIVAGVLVFALLLAFAVALPSLGGAQETASYVNILADTAHEMIEYGSSSNLVILDVRNQSEYDLGHLYGAILIPAYQLEARIGELVGNEVHEIIIYCYAGSRSLIACEILVEHNFSKVYNMVGGILAWIEAGYPIDTSYHQITVDVVDDEILSQIEPLLLYNSGCGCSAYNTSVIVSGPNVTVSEETDNYTVTLTAFEINGTLFEITSASTLLWSDTESTNKSNKTIQLKSNQITSVDKSIQFYSLSYAVRNEEYNLTIYTTLEPLNPETYNSSLTFMNYVPKGETSVRSLEFVEFNSSVTLSEQYDVLSEVAKNMERVYRKDEDDNLTMLASSYHDMSKEASYLSELVRERLTQHNHLIIHSSALLKDMPCGPCGCLNDECGGGGGGGNPVWCFLCGLGVSLACYAGCAGLCVLVPFFCPLSAECLAYGCFLFVIAMCAAYCP